MAFALLEGHHPQAILTVAAGLLAPILAPRLARKAVPYAVLALAAYGLVLAKKYHDGRTRSILYGLVLAGDDFLAHPPDPGPGRGVLRGRSVAAGAGGGARSRVEPAIVARWRSSARRGILPVQGWLLPPVAVLAID